MKKPIILLLLIISTRIFADQPIRVATWNIEHLGSQGRGFGGGYGSDSLPLRSESDLEDIASLIRAAEIDIVCLQEIAITTIEQGIALCSPLSTIAEHLGPTWHYQIAAPAEITNAVSVGNMNNAFLWNSSRVQLLAGIEYMLPNVRVGSADTFDRYPFVGYFETVFGESSGNDFVLVNIHLASGQDNDETHLVSMVMIERNLSSLLRSHGIRESDRIILGDFNDNPFRKDSRGNSEYSNLLYTYLAEKNYINLVTEELGFTRMNDSLDSIIDHIAVNSSARRHLSTETIGRALPADLSAQGLTKWRSTYSDHFPLIIELKIGADDDSDKP